VREEEERMKLPNCEQAIIDPRKLTEYSLSPDHDDGKHKARLFREVVGVSLENARLLIDALKEAVVREEAIPGKQDRYGQRYVVDFNFTGATGSAIVRSAWIIRTGENLPRLVTCYLL
jgi:hypothetical protein